VSNFHGDDWPYPGTVSAKRDAEAELTVGLAELQGASTTAPYKPNQYYGHYYGSGCPSCGYCQHCGRGGRWNQPWTLERIWC
jgi:hypothetical protein